MRGRFGVLTCVAAAALSWVVVLGVFAGAGAQERGGAPGYLPPEIDLRTHRAVQRGLDYLASQQHADGYWAEMELKPEKR